MRSLVRCLLILAFVTVTRGVSASNLAGTATDPSGAPVVAARVVLHNLATGAEVATESDGEGRFRFDGLSVGIYRVVVQRDGFSEDARTVSLADPSETFELGFVLRPGGLTVGVTVTATRNERDPLLVPLDVTSIDRNQLVRSMPLSTGDALVQAPNITPVGIGTRSACGRASADSTPRGCWSWWTASGSTTPAPPPTGRDRGRVGRRLPVRAWRS